MDAPDAIDAVMRGLVTAEERGVAYVRDSLRADAPHPVPLRVTTQLADPARCGRRARGWTLEAGEGDAYTFAVLRDLPVLGNRSQLAEFSFCTTQTGVADGKHGLVEMRLCRGTTSDDLPLRVCVENGAFYLLGLNGDNLLAGDRAQVEFTFAPQVQYTLRVLLFGKAVYAELTGANLPGGRLRRVIPDRRRFIPGRPGFGLRTSTAARSGGWVVFDWRVTPVGPAAECRLGAIGDSITAGIDGEPEAESYVHLATRALGQPRVLNTGSGGASTALDAARFRYEIAPFRPAIVWIEGGTNDIGTGVTADAAFANLEEQAASVDWGGTPIFSTVPPRVLPSDAAQHELTRLNALIRASGRPFVDRHALVCDPADPRRIRPEFCHTDGIHITRPGHVRIAAEAARVFAGLPRFSP